MSALSEVCVLIGQRASDLEKAREVFASEIRSWVTSILTAIRRTRSDPGSRRAYASTFRERSRTRRRRAAISAAISHLLE